MNLTFHGANLNVENGEKLMLAILFQYPYTDVIPPEKGF